MGALVSVVLARAVGARAGAWVAARVAPGGKIAFGMAIGIVGLLGAVAHMLMIPHPVWLWVVAIAEFLPAAYLGAWLASGRGTGPGAR